MCVCVCVYVCETEKKRKRKKEREMMTTTSKEAEIYIKSTDILLLYFVSFPHPLLSFHDCCRLKGAGRSPEVERSLMVRWVVGSILHGVDPLSYFSFQPVFHDCCNKGRGMCYPVCGMVHTK